MKTRQEVVDEINKIQLKKGEREYYESSVGSQLGNDLRLFFNYAVTQDYSISAYDCLAIGCMCGMSPELTTIFDEVALQKAIEKYDEQDSMNRFDTVAETFIDLLDFKFRENL